MNAADLLIEYALGTLGSAEQSTVEAELERSPALKRELSELEAALGSVALALPPVRPSTASKTRLLEAVSAAHRYAPFFARLSSLLDLGLEQVRDLFERAQDLARWEAGPLPGLELFHIQAGPAVAGDAGLVRLPAGFVFPEHKHLGPELVYVLEGSYTELSSGTVVRAGELMEKSEGTSHGFRVNDDSPLVYALLISGGVEIGGIVFKG